jgi:hypothetical protein
MSADIEKLAVFDSRIVQPRPKYAVEKGALSLTNAPFVAIAATSSQHTYNIYVPSENVYVARHLLWSCDVVFYQDITLTATGAAGAANDIPAGSVIAAVGREWGIRSFPLNSLVSTLSATINDTTSVINSQDVMNEVLRMCDYEQNRKVRTCPTMLDKFASYKVSAGTVANPEGGYGNAAGGTGEVPNGAFVGLRSCLADGSVPAPQNPSAVQQVNVAAPDGTFTAYNLSVAKNGASVPTTAAAIVADPGGTARKFRLYYRLTTNEPLILSPFVFSDEHELDTGLFGINNIQLVMNLKADGGFSRLLRTNITNAGLPTTASRALVGACSPAAIPFPEARVLVQFLTPSLDVPLPPKSVVPYMEFPRYITSFTNTLTAGATNQFVSQTITLPQIPDLLIIYAKPTTTPTSDTADFYLPLATSMDGVRNPLSINFDNFSGLLSSHTTEQLYEMCVRNGLDMDYNTWIGRGGGLNTNFTVATAGAAAAGCAVPLVGGPLVLKPGRDITLQSGQAPSLVGNFTLQYNITLKNNTDADITGGISLYTITVNSGFFESIRGSSRIIKGVLSEQDIISAPVAPMADTASLHRYVGGFSFKSLANILTKAKDVYSATKPAISAMKEKLPDGKIKDTLSAVGYGASGGAGTGGGRAGAGRHGKSLAARLM